MDSGSTIAAIATASGRGALAVIRVSGPGAFSVVSACIREREKFGRREPWRLGLYTFCDPVSGEVVDQVTAVKYRAPRSYTGEDMVEVIVHGGEVVPRRVLGCLFSAGAVAAGPGEFSRRAVVSGKMDLVTAEAVNALIGAVEEEECRRAIEIVGRRGSGIVAEVERTLREISSELEAGIECAEEQLGAGAGERKWVERLGGVRRVIESELRRWRRAKAGGGEVQVAIVGLANAGKSTLFNVVLGMRRSLVSEVAGTTRDYVAEVVNVCGRRVRLVDSAGLDGPAKGEADAGALREAWGLVDASDGVVWVAPMDVGDVVAVEREMLDRASGRLVAVVLSKVDCRVAGGNREGFVQSLGVPVVGGNLVAPDDGERVAERLRGILSEFAGAMENERLVINERQAQVVSEMGRILREILDGEGNVAEDMVAEGVRELLGKLEVLTGKRVDVLDEVFARFCVGK